MVKKTADGTTGKNPMFTEAVDNFVDNLGLLAGGRRAVLTPSELPPYWAKKDS